MARYGYSLDKPKEKKYKRWRPCGSPLTMSVRETAEYLSTSQQYPWKVSKELDTWIGYADTWWLSIHVSTHLPIFRGNFKVARYSAIKPSVRSRLGQANDSSRHKTIFFLLWIVWLAWKIHIIIRSKFFFLFIGREPTTWPANNCLQIIVCSCEMPSNCVWLQIIFCSYVKVTVLFFFLRSL